MSASSNASPSPVPHHGGAPRGVSGFFGVTPVHGGEGGAKPGTLMTSPVSVLMLPALNLSVDTTPANKAAVLATLRQQHERAQLRFVDDDVHALHAVAADRRLFSLQSYFAEWGYATEEQRMRVGAMPRVRALSSSRELAAVFDMPRVNGA